MYIMGKLRITCVLVIALGALATSKVLAMPMFARKTGMDCSFCHAPIPRLTQAGYEFRAAGFRYPSDIGQPEKNAYNVNDYFSTGVTTDLTWNHTKDKQAGTTATSTDFPYRELTAYPMTGSWEANWASLVELSFPPGEEAETENAYVKHTSGTAEQFVTVRAGVFHPFEGYGASDRPIGLSRPLFQTSKATGSPFKIWGFDQSGIEVGVTSKETRATFTLFNGLGPAGEPNQSGDTDNAKDIQIFANHMLGDEGAAASAYYYRGSAEVSGGRDKFHRVALYGNAPLGDKGLEALAGYGTGKDGLPGGSVKSRGFFLEVRQQLREKVYGTLRYDTFDPSTSASHNNANALTVGVNCRLGDHVYAVGECQHKTTQQGAGTADKVTDALRVELVAIL